MANKFDVVAGLSDHTLGNATATTSIALGASIIEKHFTLDRSAGGPDSSFSLEPDELKQLCEDVKTAFEASGKVDYGMKSSEQPNAKFRRSLYFATDLDKGDKITVENVRSVRPGFGLAPKHYDELMGKTVTENIKSGTPTSWDLIK